MNGDRYFGNGMGNFYNSNPYSGNQNEAYGGTPGYPQPGFQNQMMMGNYMQPMNNPIFMPPPQRSRPVYVTPTSFRFSEYQTEEDADERKNPQGPKRKPLHEGLFLEKKEYKNGEKSKSPEIKTKSIAIETSDIAEKNQPDIKTTKREEVKEKKKEKERSVYK